MRTLPKTPGFALAGVVILGLGIGANAAIFTVVNAVVLRPLPFADADRIMRLWHTPPPSLFSDPAFALSPANFIDWEAQSHSFEQMAIYRGGRRTVTGQGEPDGVVTLRASASLLPIFGLSPTLGRYFTRDDDREGGAEDRHPERDVLAHAIRRRPLGPRPHAHHRRRAAHHRRRDRDAVVPEPGAAAGCRCSGTRRGARRPEQSQLPRRRRS